MDITISIPTAVANDAVAAILFSQPNEGVGTDNNWAKAKVKEAVIDFLKTARDNKLNYDREQQEIAEDLAAETEFDTTTVA